MRQDTLERVVGFNVRRARSAHEWSQEALASAAREVGLDWSSSTVAAVETGRRRLPIGELMVLAITLGTSVAALVETEATIVRVAGVDVRGALLARLLTEPHSADTVRPPKSVTFSASEVRELHAQMRSHLEAAELDHRRPELFWRVRSDARQVGVMELARTIRVPPETVAALARKIWGRSMNEERDRRADEGASAKQRGWITRQLRNELTQEALKRGLLDEKAKPSSRRSSLRRAASKGRKQG